MSYLARILSKLGLLIGAVALFYAVSLILLRTSVGSKVIFPDLVTTIRILTKDYVEIAGHLGVTLWEFALAMTLVLTLSLLAAGAMAAYRTYLPSFEKAAVYIFSVPIIIWYPLLTIWLGLGSAPKVAYGVIAGVLPVVIALARGFRQIDWRYIDYGRSLRLSSARIVISLAVPMIMPFIVASLRVAVALCFISIVVAEMISSAEGVGYYITFHRTLLNADNVYIGIFLAMAVITVANILFDVLEVRLAGGR